MSATFLRISNGWRGGGAGLLKKKVQAPKVPAPQNDFHVTVRVLPATILHWRNCSLWPFFFISASFFFYHLFCLSAHASCSLIVARAHNVLSFTENEIITKKKIESRSRFRAFIFILSGGINIKRYIAHRFFISFIFGILRFLVAVYMYFIGELAGACRALFCTIPIRCTDFSPFFRHHRLSRLDLSKTKTLMTSKR